MARLTRGKVILVNVLSDSNGLQWETFPIAGVVEGAGYGRDA